MNNQTTEYLGHGYWGIKRPEQSEWTCYMFGSTPGVGIQWTPPKGAEPCWFWRKMQWLVFGNRWVKGDRA